MALPLLGAIVGVLLLVSIVTIIVLVVSESRQAERDTQRFERQAVALINNSLTFQGRVAGQLAALPPASMPVSLPGVAIIRHVPAGAEIPRDMAFTHQDMIRRAMQTGASLAPEASHVDKGDIMVSQVKVIPGGGFLLVGFSMAPLRDDLQALVDKDASLRLRQKIGASGEIADILLLNGEQGLRPVATKLKAPSWSLELSPPLRSSPFLIVTAAMLLSLLLVPLLAFLLVRLFETRLHHDLTALHGVTRGEELSSPLHFESMQELWSHLTGMGGRPAAAQSPSATIRTNDVAGIVEAAESAGKLPPPVRSPEAAAELAMTPAIEVPVAHELPESEVERPSEEDSIRELSPLEFTLSKKETGPAAAGSSFPDHVFRDYDIRGRAVTEITEELAVSIGRAIATEAIERGERKVVVGRDVRLSSDLLAESLIRGLTESGCDVVDIGEVPSPVLYYAALNIGTGSGVMVTASHNPAPDNGFKIMIAGHTLGGNEIRALGDRIQRKDFAKGAGSVVRTSVIDEYVQRLTEDVLLARTFNVVVDAGSGVAGPMAVRILEELGCTVSPLYCEPDGNFPHHDPDPTNADNLEDLLSDVAISGADLGLAFDGDGDRVVVVTNSTRIVPSDRLLMLFAREVLATQPGADVLFDVKCSRDLVSVITLNGGRPVMTKTGHSWLKAAVAESGAPLAGEMSGHFIFNDRWGGFDDGLYAAARFLEILAQSPGDADSLFAEFPERLSTPELKVPVAEDAKQGVIARLLQDSDDILDGTVNTTDGLRVEFPHGWGIVRASNTGAYLVAKFEANSEDELEMVKSFFRERLLRADPMLLLPF